MFDKNYSNRRLNFECLIAYVEEHHHLLPKSATDGKWMLNFVKYTRKTIKVDKCGDVIYQFVILSKIREYQLNVFI